jgi:hypothetical protein
MEVSTTVVSAAEGPDWRPEKGSEWDPIKILSQKNWAYVPIATPWVTHE